MHYHIGSEKLSSGFSPRKVTLLILNLEHTKNVRNYSASSHPHQNVPSCRVHVAGWRQDSGHPGFELSDVGRGGIGILDSLGLKLSGIGGRGTLDILGLEFSSIHGGGTLDTLGLELSVWVCVGGGRGEGSGGF